jgi:transglutaminase-like putative cysteine protease
LIIAKIANYTLDDIKSVIDLALARASESVEVRTLALTIVEGSTDQIAAINDWVKSNVRYISDPEHIELIISPVRFAQDFNAGNPMAGDCDDMAVLSTSIYRALGLKSNVVLIDQTGFGYDHAYSTVYSETLGKWVNIDPSSNNPLGWYLQHKSQLFI